MTALSRRSGLCTRQSGHRRMVIAMPRTCTICSHPERADIDSGLLSGTPFRHLAARFDTSTGALQRHKADHMPSSLLAAQQVEEVARADTLLGQIRAYQDRVDRLTGKAEQAGDFRTAFTGLREARGYVELLAKLAGELNEQPQ